MPICSENNLVKQYGLLYSNLAHLQLKMKKTIKQLNKLKMRCHKHNRNKSFIKNTKRNIKALEKVIQRF